jgi:hypothetical protein
MKLFVPWCSVSVGGVCLYAGGRLRLFQEEAGSSDGGHGNKTWYVFLNFRYMKLFTFDTPMGWYLTTDGDFIDVVDITYCSCNSFYMLLQALSWAGKCHFSALHYNEIPDATGGSFNDDEVFLGMHSEHSILLFLKSLPGEHSGLLT